jgi:hypothetical protein
MASPTKTTYIKTSTIRKFAKSHGKRISAEFAMALDRYVEQKVLLACKEHNGGKKTLDAAVAGYIIGNS